MKENVVANEHVEKEIEVRINRDIGKPDGRFLYCS